MTTTDPTLTLRTVYGAKWTLRASRVQRNDMPVDEHLWIIGCAHGPSGAVWAKTEDEAFDALADAGLSGAFRIDESDDVGERVARIGNYGDLHDLSDAWIERVLLDPDADHDLWRHALTIETEETEHCVEVTLKVLIYPAKLPRSHADREWLEEEVARQLAVYADDPESKGGSVVSWRVIDSHKVSP